MAPDDPTTLPVAEERLIVGTRARVTGRVRARTETEVLETVARAELAGVAVEVTRVPVGRQVDAVPPPRTEGDVTILPVLEEVLVVETRLILREEIHLRRRATRETAEIPVTLRRQRAVVERVDPVTGETTQIHPTSEDPIP
jgi:stress response protein YsnF